tara:strand:- start:361 stop:654 length:294 start_codon:yes stop_codon:yes gene_type:complete
MSNKQIKFLQTTFICFLPIFVMSHVAAEEKIIQQEEISFEKCLKVIAISENKLSIAPEVEDIADQKRVALFKLFDGTLKIKCDGEDGTITVSTKQTN